MKSFKMRVITKLSKTSIPRIMARSNCIFCRILTKRFDCPKKDNGDKLSIPVPGIVFRQEVKFYHIVNPNQNLKGSRISFIAEFLMSSRGFL